MTKPKHTLLTALACAAALLATPAQAQSTNWPTRTIRLVVPYPAAGNTDNVGRLVADWLTTALGQTVIVENRAGAGGTIGAQAVARAPADGYTLLLVPSAVMTLTPQLRQVLYQPSDFAPVATAATSYGIVSARKDLPAQNLAELAALAKRNPGTLTYGSAGIATATHIAAEYIQGGLGIQLLHVPYKGSGETLNGILAGQIDVMYDPIVLPAVRDGRAKALAVTSKRRHPELPDVPTIAEQGVASTMPSWFGVFAPKGTPAAIVDRIAAAIEKSVSAPGVEKHLASISLYPDFRSPSALAKAMKEETIFYKDFLARTGIKAE